jgi:hypothetical protein
MHAAGRSPGNGERTTASAPRRVGVTSSHQARGAIVALAVGVVVGACADGGTVPDAAPAPASCTYEDGIDGEPPFCLQFCGSDYIMGDAYCAAGSWVCDSGVPISECSTPCSGPPYPGERCGERGFVCQPDQYDYERCPELMCVTCYGFRPTEHPTCSCACVDQDCPDRSSACPPIVACRRPRANEPAALPATSRSAIRRR